MRRISNDEMRAVSGAERQVFDDGSVLETDENGNITACFDTEGNAYYGAGYCSQVSDGIGELLGPAAAAAVCARLAGNAARACTEATQGLASALIAWGANGLCRVGAFNSIPAGGGGRTGGTADGGGASGNW